MHYIVSTIESASFPWSSPRFQSYIFWSSTTFQSDLLAYETISSSAESSGLGEGPSWVEWIKCRDSIHLRQVYQRCGTIGDILNSLVVSEGIHISYHSHPWAWVGSEAPFPTPYAGMDDGWIQWLSGHAAATSWRRAPVCTLHTLGTWHAAQQGAILAWYVLNVSIYKYLTWPILLSALRRVVYLCQILNWRNLYLGFELSLVGEVGSVSMSVDGWKGNGLSALMAQAGRGASGSKKT